MTNVWIRTYPNRSPKMLNQLEDFGTSNTPICPIDEAHDYTHLCNKLSMVSIVYSVGLWNLKFQLLYA
jgi:hypothetical protein